jgi:transcriptional regulator NrdR family protein
MNCPRCNSDNNGVVDSRSRYAGRVVERRRQCRESACLHRWSTTEVPRELFEQFVGVVSTYLGVEEAIESTSSEGRALLDQFFGLSRTD